MHERTLDTNKRTHYNFKENSNILPEKDCNTHIAMIQQPYPSKENKISKALWIRRA